MKVSVIHSAFGDTPHVVAFVDVPEQKKWKQWSMLIVGKDMDGLSKEVFEYAYRWTVMLHFMLMNKEWGLRSTSVGLSKKKFLKRLRND